MSWEMELDDRKLEDLYEWIDSIPLTRPKKRVERDFSDGCMVAEIVRYFLPQFIDLHNYTPANNIDQKKQNWGTLNGKVFTRFGLNVPENIITNICNSKPGYIEVLLYNLRYKVTEQLEKIEKTRPQMNTFRSTRGSKTPRGTSTLDTSRVVTVKSRVGNTNAPVQMVPRMDYEEKVQECLEQAEALEVLQAKVRRLEHLLQLKDIRIQDLSERLDKYRPTAPTSKPVK